jgi:hypothetical protein
MTRWHDHPSVRKAQQRQKQEHEAKVAANVRKLIFEVFRRALAGASFISKVEVDPADDTVLVIHRHEDVFHLRVNIWNGRANVVVTRAQNQLDEEYVYIPQYFGVQFYLTRMGKVRKSALLLRKKLELFDVYQVTNS